MGQDSVLMVSHSQTFMNNVCTHIVLVSEEAGILRSGNYDSFINSLGEE